MFAKLFQKNSESQPLSPSSQLNITQQSMSFSELAPGVSVHYGIPSTASVLAFDHIQRLLAIGTLDGRIKVIGGDNIEGLLISPKALPFKNLQFLQNQGFLVSVSNENEVLVWDLEKRCISYNVQWESNITAFSVLAVTNYMYVGDEYGFLSVLKYDAEEGNILHLPYHIPPNFIAEGAGISLPDNHSIVGVLSQPCLRGNRVLIAYESGLIVLWDVTQDRVVHVRSHKDLYLKEGVVCNFLNNESYTYLNDSLDNEEAEKEVCSLCWVSPDGSVLAVGYVDGDILLWNISVSDDVNGQKTENSPNDVVKVQLSSGERRLPVIVLHWSSKKFKNGQLFVYGGEDIGSEEVLTILDLDWSSGLVKLKCVARTDLALNGSFADVIVISNAYEKGKSNMTSLFVLTNPGQLHFYEYASLSIFKSAREQNHSANAVQYQSVIPTIEPYMTVGKLQLTGVERDSFIAFSELYIEPDNLLTGESTKWPLTGGVPCQMSTIEYNTIERIYIGGYQDGSVRIWDATFPVLSLLSVLGGEIKGFQVNGASAPVSALDFSLANYTLAVGNECGVVFLYKLQGNSSETTVTTVTETKYKVHNLAHEERNHCAAIHTILNFPVRALQFAPSGVRLLAGFESGQVAVFDTSSLSVLFVTDCSKSPIISLAFETCAGYPDKSADSSENASVSEISESATEIAFVLTRDGHLVLMDSSTGNLISLQTVRPKEKCVAISMHLLGKHPITEGSKKDSVASSQVSVDYNQPLQISGKIQSVASRVEDVEEPDSENKPHPAPILLCCEDAFYFYSLESVIQGGNDFVREFKLEKPCSWSTIFKKNSEECGLIMVYQTGEIEIRSLPDLELLGNTSMMSILRWNFKNNMDKTMSSSDSGQITMANGGEFAFVSLLAFENEFRIPESLPCLHDKILAAAANVDVSFSQNQKKTQNTVPGFVSNMIKGLKGGKQEHDMNNTESRETLIAHLEQIFSRFPFSDPTNDYDQEEIELNIDDIDIEIEPVPVASSSQKSSDNLKGKEAERGRLFEGGSTDTKPKTRTREEIIAKYRNTGDAASAASQAKDKLLERQEKLEKLSRRTEELQSGAENFASMANELAKTMEKRKWWNI